MTQLLVRYFGSVADVTGTPQEFIDENMEEVETLIKHLVQIHPGIASLVFQVSVNQEIRSDNPALNNGDEVALLPPFAGG